MQGAYSRGMRQAEARGHRISPVGETEYQRRRRLAMEAGETPYQRRQAAWNLRYPGMSQSWYRRMYRRYIAEINERSSPDVRITPAVIYSQLIQTQNNPLLGHDEEWVENRLIWKLAAMQQYQDAGSNALGYQLFIENQLDPLPPEWWYYH